MARGNHGDGFSIGGTGHFVFNNRASGNLEDGFDAVSEGIDLVRNLANHNLGVGIEISLGANNTRVKNNRAKGNRLDFCDEGTSTAVARKQFGTTDAICVIGY